MPVLYASRPSKGAERQYSVTDLEALAVIGQLRHSGCTLWAHILRL